MILCSFPSYFPRLQSFILWCNCKPKAHAVSPIAILTLKADVSHQAVAEKTESSEMGKQTGDGSHVAFVFPPDLPNL